MNTGFQMFLEGRATGWSRAMWRTDGQRQNAEPVPFRRGQGDDGGSRGKKPYGNDDIQTADVPVAHSITLSARSNTDGGMATPSALAVFWLTASSKRVGCSMGRSAGFAPLTILSM